MSWDGRGREGPPVM